MVFAALLVDDGFEAFVDHELVAPPVLWPELRSALHVARVRNVLSRDAAAEALDALGAIPVAERRHRSIGSRAWAIADRFDWSKTYDAEYLALADLLGASIVTFDVRVRRAAERLGVLSDIAL